MSLKKNRNEETEIKEGSTLFILAWIRKNIKFLLIPGSRIEGLSKREFEYETQVSKRKFISRLITPLTILGIGIIFVVVTFVLFVSWIAP